MNQEILSFIQTQRLAVLALEMLDGSPHASTVHFAHAENPLIFLFETYRTYRKSEPLFGRELSRASLVIGFDESNVKTLQLDGQVRLMTPEELPLLKETYLTKFPEKKVKAEDPKVIFFIFTPTWWRFSDWTRPGGKLILSSEDTP